MSRSPDGTWDAFIWDHNVYVRPARLTAADPDAWRTRTPPELRSGCDALAVPGALPPPDADALPVGSIALTRDGSSRWGYGLYRFGIQVARVDAERYRLSGDGITWSPDSRKFVLRRDNLRGVRIYPLYSSTSNQPVDHSYFYAAPGDTATLRYDYHIFDVTSRTGVRVEGDPHGLLGTTGEARWGRNAAELYVMHTARGSRAMTLSLVDTNTGSARPIVGDTMPTFVEARDWEIVNGGDVLWVSERDGWGHLYRHGRDGTPRNRITAGSWAVAAIQHADTVRRQVWFTAWGMEPGVPYYAHLYRVNFDGSGLTHLTAEPGITASVSRPAAATSWTRIRASKRPG